MVPTAGALAGEISGELHTGLYSEEFYAVDDLGPLGVAAGQKVTFGGTFHVITENDNAPGTWSNTRELLEGVWRGQATPFANVIVNASAGSIAAGGHDAAIARWVSHVKQFLDRGGQRSLIVAPLQEHNGTWTTYGCDPANYKAAYRKFFDAFRSAGIDETQVRFAWAPNGWTSPGCGSLKDYYPGGDIVDIIAISAYNFGTCVPKARYETPAQAFDPYLNEIRATIPGATAKPFMIAQTASPKPSCGGDQSGWTRTMIEHLANDPNVVGFVWFNYLKETEWRVWAGSSLSPGWTQGVDAGRTVYQWPLTGWFTKGELTIGVAPEVVPCKSVRCDSIISVDIGSRWGLWDGLRRSHAVSLFYFGDPGDLPFMGDWDGDGIETPGLYRQSDGFVVSIWRPSRARVYIINELGANGAGLGAAEYFFDLDDTKLVPFVGDFDGDGIDTIGFYRPSNGSVNLRNSNSAGAPDMSFPYGVPGDQILVGDWDGDRDDTVGLYRPSSGRVYVNLENTNGAADLEGYVGTYPSVLTAGNR